ncbi:MAG: uroporphyrinogen decarboxylase family protein [Planctomycetota bacterium]|jgi:uroporphyrinogen-III decarboxylase
MTPRERLLRTLRGERADRVPLVLPGFECRSREGLEAVRDPRRREVAGRVFDQTTFEVGVPSYINRYLVTPPARMRSETKALPDGTKETRGAIDTPKGELTFVTRTDAQTTWTVRYPVEERADIEKIASVPWELPEKLAPPDMEALPEGFTERGIVRTGISSPFVCVGGMMPYQMFLGLCATDLDLVRELTEICRRRVLDCLDVLFSKPGIEYVWMGGSEWVTPPMASPAIYDALVQEQERSIIDYVHGKSDAIVHIHCHGRVRDALPKTIERGGDFTEPVEPPPDGDITMAEAKALAGGRVTLGGNLEARVLYNESEAVVEAAARAAFEGGKERFILQPTAGHSPELTERELLNYMRVIDVWEELSPIG